MLLIVMKETNTKYEFQHTVGLSFLRQNLLMKNITQYHEEIKCEKGSGLCR